MPVGVSNKLWRVYLGTDVGDGKLAATKPVSPATAGVFNGRAPAQQRRQAAVSIFGRPPDKFNSQEATWRGHSIHWGTVFHHYPQLVQEIMWDLHWSSFRFDLIAFDRYLAAGRWVSHKYEQLDALSAVFGTADAFMYEDGRVEDCGIASSDEFERERSYATLASLMDAWPCWSESLRSETGKLKADAVAFCYCSTFAYTFGRPPILPKLVPVVLNDVGIYPYPAVSDANGL